MLCDITVRCPKCGREIPEWAAECLNPKCCSGDENLTKPYTTHRGIQIELHWIRYLRAELPNLKPIGEDMKAFDRVLVRMTPDQKWMPHIFSNKVDDLFSTIDGGCWKECIPYEGNEQLLGTVHSFPSSESEFKFGDHVEVSSNQTFWIKAVYYRNIPMTSSHLVVTENDTEIISWKHCRKADW